MKYPAENADGDRESDGNGGHEDVPLATPVGAAEDGRDEDARQQRLREHALRQTDVVLQNRGRQAALKFVGRDPEINEMQCNILNLNVLWVGFTRKHSLLQPALRDTARRCRSQLQTIRLLDVKQMQVKVLAPRSTVASLRRTIASVTAGYM